MYLRRDLNPHAPYGALDFKSSVSTSSTTQASLTLIFEQCIAVREGFEPSRSDSIKDTLLASMWSTHYSLSISLSASTRRVEVST